MDGKTKNNKIKRIFQITILILIVITLIDAGYQYAIGKWRFSYGNVKVENFALCDKSGISITPEEDNGQIALDLQDKHLCVHGSLISETDVRLGIILLDMETSEFIARMPITEQDFHPGYFMRRIPIQETLTAGNYTINVYLFREIITSLNFSIPET